MRDGSLIATGKGNASWNKSAPHGAGRLMSRKQARQKLSLDEFKKTMKGIYSTSLSMDTLDEAPFAYKPMDEIISNVQDTVEINNIIKPIYNFKASNG
ncbi:MAG TPA: RNA-splicing ligase RtcB, partial [Paenibacillaceae bacterium]|nr:RNA-splicing ligase RtcB [Paenibacillaceae bacterium]